ncbi:MAG: recombinase family protein [Lachnospiraceae bacterium]|nr:recombinase family protein [Lachnospiraceae bacterium]
MSNRIEYAMYLRKSRADRDAEHHGKGETLARHEELLTALANKMNISVTDIYREIVSGETISSRPEMLKLLENIEAGRYAGVLVVEVERLARGATIDQGIVAQAFQLSNTKIITPTKTYDPNNEFDEEYFEFGLFMARREYKTINRRIQRGRIAASNEGRYVGSTAPYGYERYKIPGDKGYSLRIIPKQAEIVRLIFNLYTNGKLDEDGTRISVGTNEIANILDNMGIKPAVSQYWSSASLRDMIKNPVYIGKIRWGFDKEIKAYENGQLVKKRIRNKDCKIVEGLHEAIIDELTFSRAQEVMKSNTKNSVPSTRELRNPLSGIIYCQKCGHIMTRLGPNSKNKYSSLKCSNKSCDNISAPLYMVERKLLDSLKIWMDNYEIKLKAEQEKSISIFTDASINAVKEELDELQKQLQKTYVLLERSIYDEETFLQRNGSLKTQIQETEKILKKLKNTQIKENALLQSEKNFLPTAKDIMKGYYDLKSAAKKNELLRLLLARADYLKTEKNTRGKRENDNFTLIIYPLIPEK